MAHSRKLAPRGRRAKLRKLVFDFEGLLHLLLPHSMLVSTCDGVLFDAIDPAVWTGSGPRGGYGNETQTEC